jgi:hypothetical protein
VPEFIAWASLENWFCATQRISTSSA